MEKAIVVVWAVMALISLGLLGVIVWGIITLITWITNGGLASVVG